jgi:flagellin-specific chaperone FliS
MINENDIYNRLKGKLNEDSAQKISNILSNFYKDLTEILKKTKSNNSVIITKENIYNNLKEALNEESAKKLADILYELYKKFSIYI